MDRNRLGIPEAAHICRSCGRRPSVCTPVVYVPIKRWPKPAYLQATFGLCDPCAIAFSLNKFTDYDGAWYDLACDMIRAYKVPAANPFPEDPEFKWDEFILDPRYDPAPKEQCFVRFWRIETLAAKGLHERLDGHRRER